MAGAGLVPTPPTGRSHEPDATDDRPVLFGEPVWPVGLLLLTPSSPPSVSGGAEPRISLGNRGRSSRATASWFTSWVYGEEIRSAALFGTVGDGPDNAMTESLWFSTQIELLDRQKCTIHFDS